MLSFSWTCGCTVHARGQGQLLYLCLRSISFFSSSQLPFKLFPPFFYCINFPFYWIISISMHICCYFFHLKKKNSFCFTSSFIYYPVYLLFFTQNSCLYSFSLVLTVPFFCDPYAITTPPTSLIITIPSVLLLLSLNPWKAFDTVKHDFMKHFLWLALFFLRLFLLKLLCRFFFISQNS